MSYNERFNDAQKKGKAKQVSQDIYSWEEEDQQLVGELVQIKPFTEGKFDTEVSCYIMDTDQGRITTVLGAATDKQIKGVVEVGDLLRITFKGKKLLDDGRQVNRFRVEVAV